MYLLQFFYFKMSNMHMWYQSVKFNNIHCIDVMSKFYFFKKEKSFENSNSHEFAE